MLTLLAAVGLSGCGFGPGEDRGSAELLITQDYGREVLLDEPVEGLTESSTVLRVLDDSSDIETRYGGGFVQSVDGLPGGTEGSRRSDWFYSVNGIVAGQGAAEFPVTDGDRVWWDHRDWTDAMEIGAVVGAFPAPMAGGYDGSTWPVRVDCFDAPDACRKVESKLEAAGVVLASDPASSDSNSGSGAEEKYGQGDPSVIRFLVGRWGSVGDTPEGRKLSRGPGRSGVFARFEPTDLHAPAGGNRGPSPADLAAGTHLIGLDERAEAAQDYGSEAGLIAAMPSAVKGDGPVVWLVTGGSDAAVGRAARHLNESSLKGRYAAVPAGGQTISLPLP